MTGTVRDEDDIVAWSNEQAGVGGPGPGLLPD